MHFQSMLAALAVLAAVALAEIATELTGDNFESSISGKNALVMFKAPWCGHCKRLAPAWDELAKEKNSDSTVIGYVDCTVHDALCQKYSVTGYPTLKVFDENTGLTGKNYDGSRDLAELRKYVDANLAKACSVHTPADGGCNPKQLEYVNKMKAASKQEVADQLKRLHNMEAGHMAPELKKWLVQRIAILKQLA